MEEIRVLRDALESQKRYGTPQRREEAERDLAILERIIERILNSGPCIDTEYY